MVNTARVEFEYARRTYQLELVEDDHISRMIGESRSFYELGMLEDMARRSQPGDLVVDVGAYIGNHTVFLAGVAGLDVIAFEPFVQSVEILERNIELNRLRGFVEVHAAAAGSTSGSGTVRTGDETNYGMAQVTPGAGPVEILTVDSVVGERQVKAIKIDVEGMEIDVLEGSVETIARCDPLIYVEAADVLAERDLKAWMSERHYRFAREFNETPTRLFTAVDESLSHLYPNDLLDFGATQVEALSDLIAAVRGMRGGHHRLSNEMKEYREQIRRTTSLISEFYKRIKAGSGELTSIRADLDAIVDRLDRIERNLDAGESEQK